MMTSMARVSLHRNNLLANRILHLSQPSLSEGKSPRGNGVVLSLIHSLHSISILGAPDKCPLPPHLRDELCSLREKAKQQQQWVECDNEGGGGKILTVKHGEEAVYLKMEMPGLSKEDVKLYLDHEVLIGKGSRKIDSKFDDDEEEVEDEDNEEKKKTMNYVAGVGLSPIYMHNVDEIKAVMKDGVLKVTIPKMKDEERTDVKHIPIN